MQIAIILTVCLALYGIYCLIRMVLSVTRHGEAFTDRNVRRIRFFTYGVILCCLVMEVDAWMSYNEIASQVQFAGYTVAPYSLKYGWTFLAVFALLTEIFAAGVQIKKEQDLTI